MDFDASKRPAVRVHILCFHQLLCLFHRAAQLGGGNTIRTRAKDDALFRPSEVTTYTSRPARTAV